MDEGDATTTVPVGVGRRRLLGCRWHGQVSRRVGERRATL